jgi:hypothetical protein
MLQAAYTDSSRHYHNLDHILETLSFVGMVRAGAAAGTRGGEGGRGPWPRRKDRRTAVGCRGSSAGQRLPC